MASIKRAVKPLIGALFLHFSISHQRVLHARVCVCIWYDAFCFYLFQPQSGMSLKFSFEPHLIAAQITFLITYHRHISQTIATMRYDSLQTHYLHKQSSLMMYLFEIKTKKKTHEKRNEYKRKTQNRTQTGNAYYKQWLWKKVKRKKKRNRNRKILSEQFKNKIYRDEREEKRNKRTKMKYI